MTQRNSMNERYQSGDDKKTGKTRKSAASAKPTTKAASSVRMEDAKSRKRHGSGTGKNQNSGHGKGSSRNYQPNSPEYKKWRKIWWATIVFALLMTTFGFGMFGRTESRALTYALMGIGYAALIASVIIDVGKVRKIRNADAAMRSSSRSKKRKSDTSAH